MEPSGVEPEATGWALVRLTVRELWHEMRHPTPLRHQWPVSRSKRPIFAG